MGIREEKDHHGHSAAVMAAAAAAAESTMAAMNEEYLKRMQRHAAGIQKSLFKQSHQSYFSRTVSGTFSLSKSEFC